MSPLKEKLAERKQQSPMVRSPGNCGYVTVGKEANREAIIGRLSCWSAPEEGSAGWTGRRYMTKENAVRVAGYGGLYCSPFFLCVTKDDQGHWQQDGNREYLDFWPLDFDSQNPQEALEEARRCYDFLKATLNWDLEGQQHPITINIAVSGNKGIHLEIPVGDGGHKAVQFLKSVTAYIKYMLELETLDMKIYNLTRCFRAEGSLHHKARNREKIYITESQFKTLTMAELNDLAYKRWAWHRYEASGCRNAKEYRTWQKEHPEEPPYERKVAVGTYSRRSRLKLTWLLYDLTKSYWVSEDWDPERVKKYFLWLQYSVYRDNTDPYLKQCRARYGHGYEYRWVGTPKLVQKRNPWGKLQEAMHYEYKYYYSFEPEFLEDAIQWLGRLPRTVTLPTETTETPRKRYDHETWELEDEAEEFQYIPDTLKAFFDGKRERHKVVTWRKVKRQLRKVDLASLFGVAPYKSFQCCFHNDQNPSAVILAPDEGRNCYYYYCFTHQSCRDIIELAQLYWHCDFKDAVRGLCECLGWKLKENTGYPLQNPVIQSLQYGKDWRDRYNACKALLPGNKAWQRLLKIVDVAICRINRHCLERKITWGSPCSISVRYIADQVGASAATVARYLLLADRVGLLKRVPLENVSPSLRSTDFSQECRKNYKGNEIAYYQLTCVSPRKAQELFLRWDDSHSIREISHAALEAVYGTSHCYHPCAVQERKQLALKYHDYDLAKKLEGVICRAMIASEDRLRTVEEFNHSYQTRLILLEIYQILLIEYAIGQHAVRRR